MIGQKPRIGCFSRYLTYRLQFQGATGSLQHSGLLDTQLEHGSYNVIGKPNDQGGYVAEIMVSGSRKRAGGVNVQTRVLIVADR